MVERRKQQQRLAEESSELADGNKKIENSILLHEGFPKLGAPLTVVLVCFAQGVGPYLLGENSSPSHQLAIWY
jgi:hypothetical protein